MDNKRKQADRLTLWDLAVSCSQASLELGLEMLLGMKAALKIARNSVVRSEAARQANATRRAAMNGVPSREV